MWDSFFINYFYSCFSAACKFVFDLFFLKLVYMPFFNFTNSFQALADIIFVTQGTNFVISSTI